MLLISACLVGVKCRYDGNSNLVEELKKLHDEGNAIALCPELLGGLTVTRIPCEIQAQDTEERVINAHGEDLTLAFQLGAQKSLESAQKHNVKTAILKAKSPSCGCGQIYDGTFTKTLISGDGFTARLLKQHGIQVFTEKNYIL